MISILVHVRGTLFASIAHESPHKAYNNVQRWLIYSIFKYTTPISKLILVLMKDPPRRRNLRITEQLVMHIENKCFGVIEFLLKVISIATPINNQSSTWGRDKKLEIIEHCLKYINNRVSAITEFKVISSDISTNNGL